MIFSPPAGTTRRMGLAVLIAGISFSSFSRVRAQADDATPVAPAPATSGSGAASPTPPSEPSLPAPAPIVLPAVPVMVTPGQVVITPQPTPEVSKEPNATLDYNDGAFYFRSHNDNLVMTFGGRVHIDVYGFGGDGVEQYHRSNGTGLKPNLFFRRFILETGGIIRKKWFYWIGGNFVPQGLDNSQAVTTSAGVYDAFVGYMPVPNIKIYFGQYNQPFTMENTTSSRWTDMMERALVIRTLGTPYNKADGLTLWGETQNKVLEYALGVFGGDGQNRPNIDDRFDGTLRVITRPLFKRDDALKRFHFGGGVRHGRRDSQFVRYDAPSLSTAGGYTYWSSSYGSGAQETHIVPSRQQTVAAAELYLPFERWDIKSEFLYLHEQRREVLASDRGTSLRGGLFSGYGMYAQLSVWLLGTPRISGNPAGYYGMTKLPDGTTGAEAAYALQAVFRGEVLRMNYDSDSRFGSAGMLDAKTQSVDVNVAQFAINYWMTKHIRLTAEYSWYGFPGTPINSETGMPDNQAIAPGARSTAPGANSLHELSFRAGLAL